MAVMHSWKRRVAGAVSALVLLGAPALAQEGLRNFDCDGENVCRDTTTGLPVRVLMRPVAQINADADEASSVLRSNLRPFIPWFVFDERDVDLTDPENPQGWYKVGLDPRSTEGWVRAGDALLWNTALVVTYTNPGVIEEERRTPVLMFDTLANVQAMMSAREPEAYAAEIIDAVETGDEDTLRARGVVSMEPKRFVDFNEGFYILPVVNFERLVRFDGSEARFLQLAAAVPQTDTDIGRGATTVFDAESRGNITSSETVTGTNAAELGLEVRFVIDMTGSMQPYLDAVVGAVTRLTTQLEESGSGAQIRYGLVGYTDISSECSDCRFPVAKNFFPGGAVSAEELVKTLADDPSAKANGGGDWPETVFEGMNEAVSAGWTPNSLRVIVLIGDASSNLAGTSKNPSESAAGIRSLADDNQVRVIALHAKPNDPRVRDDWAVAERQFSAMAANQGQEQPAYIGIEVNPSDPVGSEAAFTDAVNRLAEKFESALSKVRKGDVSVARIEAPAAAAPISGGGEVAERVGLVAEETFAAALISYLGSAADRPTDLTAWAVDVDPADSISESLDVRILLAKSELNDLIGTLKSMLEALRRTKALDTDDFFAELQATMASAALDRDLDYSDVKSVAGSGLVPAWLEALPYRSQIMELTQDRFAEMTADERSQLEQSLDERLNYYEDLYNSDRWVGLYPDAAELDKVYPVSLTDLP